jgi:hypothetical protein
MVSKQRTPSKKRIAPKAKAPVKKAAKRGPKAETKPAGPRHPRGRVTDLHGGKEALAKALAPSLVLGDEDSDVIASRLKTASNMQLLRLQKVVKIVKDKWGSREKLIQAIADSTKAGKDKEYVAKLSTFSLPRLVDLAQSAARRAS